MNAGLASIPGSSYVTKAMRQRYWVAHRRNAISFLWRWSTVRLCTANIMVILQ